MSRPRFSTAADGKEMKKHRDKDRESSGEANEVQVVSVGEAIVAASDEKKKWKFRVFDAPVSTSFELECDAFFER